MLFISTSRKYFTIRRKKGLNMSHLRVGNEDTLNSLNNIVLLQHFYVKWSKQRYSCLSFLQLEEHISLLHQLLATTDHLCSAQGDCSPEHQSSVWLSIVTCQHQPRFPSWRGKKKREKKVRHGTALEQCDPDVLPVRHGPNPQGAGLVTNAAASSGLCPSLPSPMLI